MGIGVSLDLDRCGRDPCVRDSCFYEQRVQLAHDRDHPAGRRRDRRRHVADLLVELGRLRRSQHNRHRALAEIKPKSGRRANVPAGRSRLPRAQAHAHACRRGEQMPTVVLLEYPHGRTHQTEVPKAPARRTVRSLRTPLACPPPHSAASNVSVCDTSRGAPALSSGGKRRLLDVAASSKAADLARRPLGWCPHPAAGSEAFLHRAGVSEVFPRQAVGTVPTEGLDRRFR